MHLEKGLKRLSEKRGTYKTSGSKSFLLMPVKLKLTLTDWKLLPSNMPALNI
jgi:hypothetical protein